MGLLETRYESFVLTFYSLRQNFVVQCPFSEVGLYLKYMTFQGFGSDHVSALVIVIIITNFYYGTFLFSVLVAMLGIESKTL